MLFDIKMCISSSFRQIEIERKTDRQSERDKERERERVREKEQQMINKVEIDTTAS